MNRSLCGLNCRPSGPSPPGRSSGGQSSEEQGGGTRWDTSTDPEVTLSQKPQPEFCQ